ncbi:hypothetical protein M2271_006022 [Streptomyces sp. LBL]|uniref:hypothetical protein n=1 Tax=Streptomyces sp. LBL TaxID=2940562 RepID=UPI0024758E01|nr:hypothetical protein [Streptomyces sp. LBL]MDH6628190.1 hypothetical protein [Streptomyces sp. LBL]
MPYLTSASASAIPSTASSRRRTGFGIPGFAHPLAAPAEWAEWAELTRPGRPLYWVVRNVTGNGPGTRPAPHCPDAVGRLRDAGLRILGHLDEALRIARRQGAATAYFDRANHSGRSDPWETMPGYWDGIVSRVGTGVSE